jgi:hypothetical protein
VDLGGFKNPLQSAKIRQNPPKSAKNMKYLEILLKLKFMKIIFNIINLLLIIQIVQSCQNVNNQPSTAANTAEINTDSIEFYADSIEFYRVSDSCTQNGYEFKLTKGYVHNSTTFEYTAARRSQQGAWKQLFKAEIWKSSFSFKDYDKDGFKDIVEQGSWVKQVRLFNPKLNNFSEPSEFGRFRKLNDTIYFDDWQMASAAFSDLFAIKNGKKIIYASLEMHNGDSLSVSVSLYKGKPHPDKPIDPIQTFRASYDAFKLESFWKNNWQKFVIHKN